MGQNAVIGVLNNRLLLFTLWHGLHYALPRHPLLWHRLRADYQTENDHLTDTMPGWQRGSVIYGSVAILLVIAGIGWSLVGFRVEMLLGIAGSVVGLNLAIGVSSRIHRERERGRYELVALAPSGLLGASWALVTRHLRTDRNALRLCGAIDRVHVLMLFAVIPITLLTAIMTFDAFQLNMQRQLDVSQFQSPLLLLNTVGVLVLLRADYMYSLIVGALVGMFTPTITTDRTDGILASGAFFGIVQVGSYVLLLVLARVAFSLWAALTGSVSGYAETILMLLAYLAVRETIMLVLVKALARQLDVSSDQVLNIYRRSI